LQRELVAGKIDEETYMLYQQMASAGCEGFEWFHSVKSLAEMRERVRMDSTEAGLARCVWADHFAVIKVLDRLNLQMLLLDDILLEGGASPCVVVNPELPDPTRPPGFILLHRTRRQHYNLLTKNGLALFTEESLPASYREAWMLPFPEALPDASGATPAPVPSPEAAGSADAKEGAAGGEGSAEDRAGAGGGKKARRASERTMTSGRGEKRLRSNQGAPPPEVVVLSSDGE